MRYFPNASLFPGVIVVMSEAMASALAMLPHPVSSTRVQEIAKSILRAGKDVARDGATLQRGARVELQVSPRD
jgi:hypothetical protein